jgi:orotate phosphoribosyltransferase
MNNYPPTYDGMDDAVSERSLNSVTANVLGFASRLIGERGARLIEVDTKRDLDRTGVIRKGHFVFPAGYHCERYFAFGALSSHPLGNEVVDLLARRFLTTIPEWDFDHIVIHGFEMSRIADRLVELLSNRGISIHKLLVVGNREPQFLGARGELVGSRVLLLLDVVHTGQLLERLVESIHQEKANVLKIACVVNLGKYRGHCESKLIHLVKDSVESFRPTDAACKLCASKIPSTYVDPDREVESPIASAPMTVEGVRRKLADVFGQDREFWRVALAARAVLRHRIIGETHVSPAVDVTKLLGTSASRAWVSSRIKTALASLAEQGPWTIVAAPRKEATSELAAFLCELVQRELGQHWPILHTKKENGFVGFRSASALPPRIGNALILDAGVCSGGTADAMLRLVAKHSVESVALLVAIDRSSDMVRDRLTEHCKGCFFSIARVLFPTLSTRDPHTCPACWKKAARVDAKSKESFTLIDRYLAPRFSRKTRKSGRMNNEPADLIFQKTMFDDVTLKEFESLLFAVTLHQEVPTEQDESYALYCLGASAVKVAYKKALIDCMSHSLLGRERIQEGLRGLARNSIPPSLLDSVCTALARAGKFDWFDRIWLLEHRQLLSRQLTAKNRPAWLFLAYVFDAAKRHDPAAVGPIGAALREVTRLTPYDKGLKSTMDSLREFLAQES